jgi:hypothetical protein
MNWQILAVDQNFKITQNDINKNFDQLPKSVSSFLAVDQNFINVILSYFKILINWKDQVKFDQLTKKKLKKFWSNA